MVRMLSIVAQTRISLWHTSCESVGDMKMSSSQSSILADQTMVLSVGAAEASESG